MEWKSAFHWDQLIDLALISGILVAANLVLDPSDPGWWRWNPSPYILIPVVLGSRRGVGGGILAGLWAGFLVCVAHRFQARSAETSGAAWDLYVPLAYAAAGALCGELYALFHRRNRQLKALVATLQQRLQRTEDDLARLRTAKESGLLETGEAAEAVCRRLGTVPDRRIYLEPYFRQQVELAFESFLGHQLPSTLVGFYLPEADRHRQTEFERLLVPVIRNGDFPAVLSLPRPNVVVFLPLTSPRGAEVFVQRVLGHCQRDPTLSARIEHRVVTFLERETSVQLWRELLG